MARSTVKDTTGLISEYDLYLFGEGNHTRIYEKLGAHLLTVDGQEGVHFAVWAPNARSVSVVWLRTVLTDLGEQVIASDDPMLFDAPLAAALRRFQERHGLVADGIVTDRTLLGLQSAIGMAGFETEPGDR